MVSTVGPFSSGVAVGGAGVATANQSSTIRVSGYVFAVYVQYLDAPPAGTTDVTVKTVGTSPNMPTRNILVITNAATDGVWYPRGDSCTTAATVSTGAADVLIPVDDLINVTIAGANANDYVNVWMMVEN